MVEKGGTKILVIVTIIILFSIGISGCVEDGNRKNNLPGEYIKKEREVIPVYLDYIWYPSLNKEGNKIIFEGYTKEDDGVKIYIWDLIEKKLSKIPINGTCKYPRFSNNGHYIVYSSKENGTLVEVDGGGCIVNVREKTNNLWISNINGSWRRQLTFDNYLYPIFGDFSDDDRKIYFNYNKRKGNETIEDIYSIEIDGTNLTQLTDDEYSDWNPIDYNKNNMIYMSSKENLRYYKLYKLNLKTKQSEKILDIEGYYPGVDKKMNICFSSDGNIYTYNLSDNKLNRYTNDEKYFVSPDINYHGNKIIMCGKGKNTQEVYKLYLINI